MTRAARARKTLKIPEPVLTFDLWPEQMQFGTAKVFQTRRQMERYIKHVRPDKNPSDALGFTDERSREVILSIPTCDDNTVSHELFHLTMLWASYVGFLPEYVVGWDKSAHERSAEALGQMVHQFWLFFTEAGLPRVKCLGFKK